MSTTEINIPGYTVHSEIGRGGMATVYEATQDSLGRKVAIKVLQSHGDESFDERFTNEAHFIASINDPHIITIFDVAQIENGDNYIAMEYLAGGDLKANVELYADPKKALILIEHIATGLIVAHEKGIIHRDIKPANILFRENGDAVLTDFGIAKSLDDDSDLTQAGFSLGSPSYSSPEQIQGKPLDVSTDIYSLGVIFLELILGTNVFKGESHGGTAINHIQMPLPSLPVELQVFEPFLVKILAKDPLHRYRSCAELLDAIRELKTLKLDDELDVSSDDTQTSETEHFKIMGQKQRTTINRLKTVLAASVLCSFIVLGYFLFFFESATDKKIKALLAEAQVRVDTENYIHPENDNARYFYRQVLLLDEHNREALKGVEQVENVQIERFIAAGAKAIEEKRLDSPRGNNAIYYFRQILILDDDNTAANAGLQQVAEEYSKMARMKVLNQEYRHATNYINRGLRLAPENEELLELREEVINQSPSAREKLRGVFGKIRDKIR